MYYSIHLENGVLYTINPKYFDFLNEEDEVDHLFLEEKIPFLDFLKNLKEKVILFITTHPCVRRMIETIQVLPTVPEVISYTLIQII